MAAGPRFVFGGNNTKIGTSRNIARWVDDHGEHTPPPAKWTSWPTITYFLPKSIEYYHHQLLVIGKVFSTIDFRCPGTMRFVKKLLASRTKSWLQEIYLFIILKVILVTLRLNLKTKEHLLLP